MEIFNPSSASEFNARNKLLQTTMRPLDPLFEIESEYPIVLDQNHSQYSWCLKDQSGIIAHTNLWPRQLIDSASGNSYTIALIGNVATDPTRQGEGIMRELMNHVVQSAKGAGYAALILWSDLLEFYQKLGFESVGHEHRITLAFNALMGFQSGKFSPKNPAELSNNDLLTLMNIRPKTHATLARSPEEFRKLLDIPFTYLFMSAQPHQGYAIVGKGYDMVGVIHEWGVPTPEDLPTLCADVANHLHLPQVMLLCPAEPLVPEFKKLSPAEVVSESHPMALAIVLSEETHVKKALQTCFIWGLDSI